MDLRIYEDEERGVLGGFELKGDGMKIRYVILLSVLLGNSVQSNVYFWELDCDGERSCCLFVNGQDICNPSAACTRNAGHDLTQILDYISRLFLVDKGTTFSYHKLLQQAQDYINHALATGMHMYYRYDVHRKVKFYHEIAEATKAVEKSGKGGSSTSATTSAAAEKQKNEDVVLAYLIKQGLARPMK